MEGIPVLCVWFEASNRCDSIRRYPVSRSVETTIWFFRVFLPVSAKRQCRPVSARQCSRLCERHCCFLESCFQCACAISPFVSVPWLVDARIPHVVTSHLLRALDLFLLRDSANQNSMSHRDSHQRYPASITSVIQRIDTFTVVAALLDLQPYSVGPCETHSLHG